MKQNLKKEHKDIEENNEKKRKYWIAVWGFRADSAQKKKRKHGENKKWWKRKKEHTRITRGESERT